jgi:type IV secretory pathway component VirB8
MAVCEIYLEEIKNMEQEILEKFEIQEKKLNDIYRSVEKTRKYFLWTLIITVVVMVLPLIGIMFIVPKLLSTYTEMFQLYNF